MCSNLGALRINLAKQFWTCLIMYRERPVKSELQKSRRKRTTEMTIKFLCCGKVMKMANIIDASEFYHNTAHCTHHKHQLLYSSLVTESEITLVIVLRITLVIVLMTNTGHCTHHTSLDQDPSKQKWTVAHLLLLTGAHLLSCSHLCYAVT